MRILEARYADESRREIRAALSDGRTVIMPDTPHNPYRPYLDLYLEAGGLIFDPPAPPPPALEEHKQAKRAEISAMREDKLKGATVEYAIPDPANKTMRRGQRRRDNWLTYTFQADRVSLANLISTVAAINAGVLREDAIEWRSQENELVPLSRADVRNIAGLMVAELDRIYTESFALKDALEQAASLAEVDAIVWPAADQG